jgi:hypothetical protein
MSFYRFLSLIIFSAFFFGACGGGGTSTNQPNLPASNIVVNEDANGCLISNNADLSIDYLIVDKNARNLVWKCPDSNMSETQFYNYNYTDQCYQRSHTYNSLSCSNESSPTTPLFDVTISQFTGNMYPIGGGVVTFNHTAIAENNGNVDAFAIQWEIIREPGQVLQSGTFDHINKSSNYPNFQNAPGVPVNFTDIAIGQNVQFTFQISSAFGDILDSQTIILQP